MNNLRIVIFFFIAAIVGTLLHECGHALASIYFGFHPTMHYAYCHTVSTEDWIMIKAGLLEYEAYPQGVWIALGGPLQTILTGFTGLTGLLVLNRRAEVDAWKGKHLFWIVLTFFHSREVFNVLTSMFSINTGRHSMGDETGLFYYWDIDQSVGHWTVMLISGLILAYTTFFLVKKHHWQLILFGAAGSLCGGFVWLLWLGPLVLP